MTVTLDNPDTRDQFTMPENAHATLLLIAQKVASIETAIDGLKDDLKTDFVRRETYNAEQKAQEVRLHRLEKAGAWIVGVIMLTVLAAVLSTVLIKG